MTGRMCWFGWRVRRRSDFRALSLRDGEKEKKTSRVVSPAVIARQGPPARPVRGVIAIEVIGPRRGGRGEGSSAEGDSTHVANVEVAYTARWATAERERGGREGGGRGVSTSAEIGRAHV